MITIYCRIENNESWYSKMNPMELIAESGRYLRMGSLLSRTSVKSRIESSDGMSFTEFCYQLFQAHDWLHLLKEYDCLFQVKNMILVNLIGIFLTYLFPF